MNSVKLTVRALEVIEEITGDICGYGDERKNSYTISLSKENDKIKMDIIYDSTSKVIFSGLLNETAFFEATKIEDDKEKEKDKDE